MFQTKVVEKIKAHILCAILFLKRAVNEIMWKNIVERGRSQMTIWRMRIACRIRKDIDTHLAYVKVIAFPRQRSLRERVSNLCYTYVTSLVTLRKVAAYWNFY